MASCFFGGMSLGSVLNYLHAGRRVATRGGRRAGDCPVTALATNIAYVYEPRGAAVELLCCRAPEVLIEGPRNTGKTRSCLQKIFAVAERYPKCRILIARKTRASLTESILVEWEDRIVPPGHACLKGHKRSHLTSYDFANGSTVVISGLDKPDRQRSAQFDIIYIPEATECEERDINTLVGANRNKVVPYQQIILDCNPKAPGHWLNQRPEQKRENGSPRVVRLLSRHEDNPSCTEADLEKLRNLTGVARARDYEGKWVAAEGLIYDFRRADHVIEIEQPVLADWPRTIVGCDDGTHNPFAGLRARIGPDDQIHIEREWPQGRKAYRDSGFSESAKIDGIKSLATGSESVQIDPAAGVKLAMRRANLPIQDADNEVLKGISRVGERFSANRITIDPSCCNLIDELESYEWKDNAKKDEPLKQNDHMMDALRYLIAKVDGGKGARVVLGYDAEPPVIVGPPAPKPKGKTFAEMRKDPDWGFD